jgi:hypothetical protein
MIAPQIVSEVRRLLAERKLGYRKIAELTGISRGSVGAIATGRRPDYEPQPREEESDEPNGSPERCPGCGGLSYMPCRLCRVRKAMSQRPRPASRRPQSECVEPLELNLRPEHRARFEEVLARRRAVGGEGVELGL